MITKRDIASIFDPFFATYVARDLGLDVGKLMCSLDETLISTGAILSFLRNKIHFRTDSTS